MFPRKSTPNSASGSTSTPPLPKLAIACAVVALAAAFSCKTFDLPNETCNPQDLDANRLRGESADGDCTKCLEENCCDKVGVCERKEGCADTVRNVHDCVLKAGLLGAERERTCATDNNLLPATEANDAYRCMRDSCGERCGLPVCRVNQAAVLVATAGCDSCFSSSCCPQLNACYGSRACKLMVECIATECRDALATSLSDSRRDPRPGLGGLGGDATREVARICAPGPAPADFGAPACVRACLCRFAANDQGLEPEDDAMKPFILGKAIYDCGVQADCGPKCSVEAGAGSDASTE